MLLWWFAVPQHFPRCIMSKQGRSREVAWHNLTCPLSLHRWSLPVQWSCQKEGGQEVAWTTGGMKRRISSSVLVNGAPAEDTHPSFITQKKKMVRNQGSRLLFSFFLFSFWISFCISSLSLFSAFSIVFVSILAFSNFLVFVTVFFPFLLSFVLI